MTPRFTEVSPRKHSASMEFVLLLNLVNAAKHHKKHCDEDCDVSLSMLRALAVQFASKLTGVERDEAQLLILTMPVT